ncbi:hypothetical protein C900_04425 [Fulvivirga imtechensis AK7]|uniref:Lipoprotein n=1 Tax=Fulvivirga imtechensis AK7 TaxID=1237149 RepID=L8JP65_9BACT|nr:hypothetical protein [Fulvivirga imtechensis]ELR69998.1 hypothetical protein C900_04425 [Fulvivirga imtechensis AK7]
MNKLWAISLVLFALLTACEDEEGATPGNSATYIRLFGGSNSDIAYMAIPTSDGGVLCLGTTEIETPTESAFRIRLIKTDINGNIEWQQLYPQEDQEYSLVGRSVLAVEDGYIIVGDSIKDEDNSSLVLFKVDLSGNEISGMKKTDTLENARLHGIDLIRSGDDNSLVVLASIESDKINSDLYLARINSSDLTIDPDCRKFYTGGNVDAVKSLYQTNNGDLVFSGTVNAFSSGNARLFRVPDCTSSLISGPLLVQGTSKNYTINQVVPAGNGFAMVGTTNDTDNGSNDIFLARLGPLGAVQFMKIYNNIEGAPMTNAEEGLTITTTNDGGFLLGGSTLTNTKGEIDIIIIKTDAFGAIQWSRRFGDINEEYATYVTQAPDGGYLIFGNTEFGGIDTMILIKTDSEGNVE